MSEKDFDEKINKLSMMEQNVQYLASQRQSFQNQLVEIDSALEELETSDDSYRIIGNIMVQKSKPDLQKDLNAKKEVVDVRIKTIEKQEKSLKEKSDKMREEVMKGLEKSKGGEDGSVKGSD